MVHVPYKGMGQVLTDLIPGTIQMAFANTPNAAPLVKEGKLRAIAVAHPQPRRAIAGRADGGRTGLPRL
jgi:tripartite-type tricarboxylate transporter receptor subunit TctC